MLNLKGKNILLVISGGIAAYKSLELIRSLKKSGSNVHVILTQSAKEFVTELTVSQLSQNEVHTNLFDYHSELHMGHINLSRTMDLIVVAPATANIIAKMANGIADDLASTTLLASNKPIIIVPAMNPQMYQNAITKNNIKKIRENGIYVFGPSHGETACGENGMGRMEEPADILGYIIEFFRKRTKLKNKTAFVTAGPTIEPIDPVRYITNNSSGKQGYAIAASLSQFGARTTLISGPSNEPIPDGVKCIKIDTAKQMLDAVQSVSPADIGIFAAAVADWKVKNYSNQKIKKDRSVPSLELTENTNIIKTIVNNPNTKPKLAIGFAAETENLIENAKNKLEKVNMDWLLANDVSEKNNVFNGDDNTIVFFNKSNTENWKKMSKMDVANKLSNLISEYFE